MTAPLARGTRTRARSSRNSERHHPGIPGDIMSEYPGDFVGICTPIAKPVECNAKSDHSTGFSERLISKARLKSGTPPVHDSFIVQSIHGAALRGIMDDVLREKQSG
jgi:hypothetical protein